MVCGLFCYRYRRDYTVYLAEETAGVGYDYYVGDSVARTKEMGYYDVKEVYGNYKVQMNHFQKRKG